MDHVLVVHDEPFQAYISCYCPPGLYDGIQSVHDGPGYHSRSKNVDVDGLDFPTPEQSPPVRRLCIAGNWCDSDVPDFCLLPRHYYARNCRTDRKVKTARAGKTATMLLPRTSLKAWRCCALTPEPSSPEPNCHSCFINSCCDIQLSA